MWKENSRYSQKKTKWWTKGVKSKVKEKKLAYRKYIEIKMEEVKNKYI